MISKNAYFKLVDRRWVIEGLIKELNLEYNKLVFTDDEQAITENELKHQALRKERAVLMNRMEEERKDIPQERLNKWSVEYLNRKAMPKH